MTNSTLFYEMIPTMAGLDRLDLSAGWSDVAELWQQDLAELDHAVASASRTRPGSNRGGGARLFVYRVYEAEQGSGIDAVVVGILVRSPASPGPDEHFEISGDIVGETNGDVLFDVPPRDVIGRTALTEAGRDLAATLVQRAAIVSSALGDASRNE